MTRIEKKIAQKLSDEISRNAAALSVLGYDVSDIFDTLRDINESLVITQASDDLGPLPSFEEHARFIRESVYAGSAGDTP